MLRKFMLSIIILILLSGCSTQTGEKDLMDTIQKMEVGIKSEDYTTLRAEVQRIRELYDKHDWKIHLIGDEDEYEGLYESINRLAAAIEAEEKGSIQIELATLRSIVHDIFSL